jgi:dethiobiotin synthetase
MKKYFVTGISTEVGKTVVSAILTEALEADYWKPIQSGELDNTDTHKIERYISNSITKFHDSAYALEAAMSPHASADLENIEIDINKIVEPITDNDLVIEGAGGLLVPLNYKDTIINLIKPEYEVILVSRHYLGSINHTLLSLDKLTSLGFKVKVIFSGEKNHYTESVIERISNVEVLGRIDEEPYFDKNVIKQYAQEFKSKLV